MSPSLVQGRKTGRQSRTLTFGEIALPAGQSVSQDQRVQRWYHNAVTSPDQVRQRVAWALGQIVITSDRDDFLANEPIMVAEWNDIIVRNALGNYRNLLQAITLNVGMGYYLNTKGNLKENTAGRQPDENYAR